MQFACPTAVQHVLLRLEALGYVTYLVGGCLRDARLGVAPRDWDLATAAPPEFVRQAFDRVIPVGLQHGTVTVWSEGLAMEVTTFRGGPAGGLMADLAARDFTINAMAWHPGAGWVDPHGGHSTLRTAVGDGSTGADSG